MIGMYGAISSSISLNFTGILLFNFQSNVLTGFEVYKVFNILSSFDSILTKYYAVSL